MNATTRPLAVVTGASSGIGLELATLCLKNKLQVAMAGVTPAAMLAEQHRKQAEPGTGRQK